MGRAGTRLIDRPEFKTKPKPVTFLADDKVSKAVTVMSEKNYGSVIIVDKQENVIGVVPERAIVKKLVNAGLSPKNTKLEKIMTKNPRVANENDNVIDWLRIMSNDRFRRLPVVDENNKIKKTEVVTGIRKDGNLEILEGLNANEKVVKEGLARLADGMTVRPLTK